MTTSQTVARELKHLGTARSMGMHWWRKLLSNREQFLFFWGRRAEMSTRRAVFKSRMWKPTYNVHMLRAIPFVSCYISHDGDKPVS